MPGYVQDFLARSRMARPQPTTFAGGAAGPVTPQGTYRGLGKKSQGPRFQEQIYGELPERYGRSRRAYDRYEGYLDDPTSAGRQFQSFFEEAGKGISDPAMRDFTNQISGVQANTAARFGGNASSEEQRNVYNTSDLFTRNLTEALARLAPQAAGLGVEFGGQLGTAAHGAVSEQDQLTQMILAAIEANKKKGGGIGGTIGSLAGTAIGTLLAPGAGTAVGAKIGSKVG